ncbi:MAG: hypothetical protein ACQET3_12735, partial [Promethearchaeati archaeon]
QKKLYLSKHTDGKYPNVIRSRQLDLSLKFLPELREDQNFVHALSSTLRHLFPDSTGMRTITL